MSPQNRSESLRPKSCRQRLGCGAVPIGNRYGSGSSFSAARPMKKLKRHSYDVWLLGALAVMALPLSPALAGPKPQVEYITERSPSELLQPVEKLELCRSIQTLLRLTNGLPAHETIVGWSVKKSDSDQPPMLKEEAILFFELQGGRTNGWIIACIERSLGRGGRPGLETWREGCHGKGMDWVSFSAGRPSDEDLRRFMLASNFGLNECTADVEPIHVAIYAPFKRLLKTAAQVLPPAEKQRRSNGRADILWD